MGIRIRGRRRRGMYERVGDAVWIFEISTCTVYLWWRRICVSVVAVTAWSAYRMLKSKK